MLLDVDLSKIKAAARAVPLTTRRLIDRTTGRSRYCVMGAMLHAAGVSDEELEVLDGRDELGYKECGASAGTVLASGFRETLRKAYGRDVEDCLDRLEAANDSPFSNFSTLDRVLNALDDFEQEFDDD